MKSIIFFLLFYFGNGVGSFAQTLPSVDSNRILVLNQHIDEINEKENRNRSIATLVVDPALTTNLSSPGSFDFTSGT